MGNKNSFSICFVRASRIHGFIRGERAGGAERQIVLLAKELVNRGHDISIVTESFSGPAEEYYDGIRLINGPPRSNSVAGTAKKGYEYLKAIQRADADIYYVRGDRAVLPLIDSFTRFQGGRFMFNVSNDSHITKTIKNIPDKVEEQLFSISLKDANALIAQTNRQKSILESRYGVNSTVIPNGYSIPPQEELATTKEREYFLWVGRLDPNQKKPMRFLDIADTHPDIRFRMIGPVRDGNNFHNKVKCRAEGCENVDFRGFVPPDEIYSHYRNAIALINTSDYEGFPNTFLEAWRYGTPTISMYHPMDGLLKERRCGLLSGNFDTLVSDVEDLATDDQYLSNLSQKTRDQMKEKYSIKSVVDTYEKQFKEL